jgi:hypothetical protein
MPPQTNVWNQSTARPKIRLAQLFLLLTASLFLPWKAIAQNPQTTGQVQGTVFVLDSAGRAYVTSATVILNGPTILQTESDEEGSFTFAEVRPGSYTIEATSAGLEGQGAVSVQIGKTAQVSLELKAAAVNDSVTVTAPEDETTTPSPSETISSSVVRDAPNKNERAESVLLLIPGVVRGPDGRINLKGARSTQSGALVNSANATDPATGSPGIDLPIDVVASVQVISNPYDPQYGKLTGAVSTLETKTGDYEKFHISVQNLMPRARVREGSISGLGAATPRVTFTGPLKKDRIAFTQSFEYRFVRTPVNSLPASQRDTKVESVNSYTQLDAILSSKQTATVSLAVYPQKLQYLGLNTFTPQPSTTDYHQRGYQLYGQHHYQTGKESLLTSQISYKKFDVDLTPAGAGTYRLFLDTTEGGSFNSQSRRASRFDWQETYQFGPRHFLGSHQWRAGLEYAYSSYEGHQSFLPVEIEGADGLPAERIVFTPGNTASVSQHEVTSFIGDRWTVVPRLILDLGLRLDSDTVTSSAHVAPRAGFQLALTRDGRTMLQGGVGEFYDRVPLMIPAFRSLPERTVLILNPVGDIASSTAYTNEIVGGLRNPKSTAWNLAVTQKLSSAFMLKVGYEQRNTAKDFAISSVDRADSGLVTLSNTASQSYREWQLTGRYRVGKQLVNAAYVHSRAYGDLNDYFQFFGNVPKPVIQPDATGRLSFDAPNRFLFWGEFAGPWKLTFLPVYDVHTGFPYSVQNELREYVGPRNTRRFPEFSSADLQILRPVTIQIGDRSIKARAGMAIFNIFNHFNPRDVQDIQESPRFGGFFNNAWREFRGKFVLEF